jgi:hypothetical protein
MCQGWTIPDYAITLALWRGWEWEPTGKGNLQAAQATPPRPAELRRGKAA